MAIIDDVTTLLSGIAIDKQVGTHTIVAFDLTWPHSATEEALFGLHIQNDVTKNYSTPKPGTTLAVHDIAEATLLVNSKSVGL